MPTHGLYRSDRIAAAIEYVTWLQKDPVALTTAKAETEAAQQCHGEGGGGFEFVFHSIVLVPGSADFWFGQSYREGLSTFMMNFICADIRRREGEGQEIPAGIRSKFEGFIEESMLAAI